MKRRTATRISAVVALLTLGLGLAACGGGDSTERFSPPDDFEFPELEEALEDAGDVPEIDFDQRIHDFVEQGLGADIYPDN